MIGIFFIREPVGPREIFHIITDHLNPFFLCLLSGELQVVADLVISGKNNNKRKKDKSGLDKQPQYHENKVDNQDVGVCHPEQSNKPKLFGAQKNRYCRNPSAKIATRFKSKSVYIKNCFKEIVV